MNIGDTVLVPCQVISVGTLAYTGNLVLDLAPIEKSSGKPYAHNVVRRFSVCSHDVVLREE